MVEWMAEWKRTFWIICKYLEGHCMALFMACNQAWPIAKATVIQSVPGVPSKAPSMLTKPKELTLWHMLSTSPMAEPHDYQLRQTILASA